MENVLNALTPNTLSLGDDNDYAAFVEHLKKTLLLNKRAFGKSLFQTAKNARGVPGATEDGPIDLKQIFLSAFPDSRRQHYTCRCCTTFVDRFGSLVYIDDEGKLRSAIWDAATFNSDNFFYSIVALMQSIVESGTVTGSFKTQHMVLGAPVSGGWNHMYVEMERDMLAFMPHKSPEQQAAIVAEDFKMLTYRLGLPEYSLANLTKLQTILEADVLQNQNVIKGPATFLFRLAKAREATKNTNVQNNLVWKAASTASAGLMHSDVCDNVLEMLNKGADFDAIKKRFGKITQADTYRRSQAPAADGAIEAAEKFFTENGYADSLRRRLALPADIPEAEVIWRPKEVAAAVATTASLFGHMKQEKKAAAQEATIDLPRTNMSWNKFVEEVLPKALKLEIKVPAHEFFAGLATAAVAESPVLYFYENHVSPYAKMGKDRWTEKPLPVPAENWNLTPNSWHPVDSLIPMPHMWGGQKHAHMKEQLLFVLPGAYDVSAVDHGQVGSAVFPQLLKPEFHEYSAVINQFSNTAAFEATTKEQVAGLAITRSATEQRLLRVTTELGQREVLIDRWE
jgi:hypothetical protein